MSFLFDRCTFGVLNENIINECHSFLCGNDDLDEFFQHDAPLYSRQLLGKSYCFRLDDDMRIIVCAFTVSNDSIRVDFVDAYNEEVPLCYYEKNGFKYLFSTESQEAEYTGFDPDTHLKTRLMFF
jgi:hypothetical protein